MADKKNEGSVFMPVQLHSLEDIARLAYNFNFTSNSVFAGTSGTHTVLYAFGEKLDGVVLTYTFTAEHLTKFLLYRPPENSDDEKARFSDSTEEGWQVVNILSMNIGKLGISKTAGKAKFKYVEMGSFEDLVKLAINSSSGEDNTLAQLYCFESNTGCVAYGLDLIDRLHDGECIVYYTNLKEHNKKGFALYDYKTGRVAFTGNVGEHSYMYLKIINLAEKPAFFH